VGGRVSVSDLLISSRPWTTQNPVIDGVAQAVTASLNGLYLLHPTGALSMLSRLVVAMTAGGVASPAAFITEAGYVRLTSSGTFTIDWTGATTLRDLLGFTGNLSGASAYTAPNRSTLLWVPARTLTPELAPLGANGQPFLDVSRTVGTGGNLTVRQHGSPNYLQRFSATHIARARYWATMPAGASGEYRHFWEAELTTLRRWIVLRDVTIGSSTTTSADYSLSTHVGPYFYNGEYSFAFSRAEGFTRVEAHYPVSIPAIVTAEYS
jgi:hypothetical protein